MTQDPKRKKHTLKVAGHKLTRKDRRIGITMKKPKSLGDLMEQKMAEKSEHDTFARDEITCPHCGCEHDEDAIGKKTSGTLKCLECGEAFEYEAMTKTIYTTYVA